MDFQTHLFLGAWHDSPAFGNTTNPGFGLLVRHQDFLVGAGVWRNSLKDAVPYGFVGYQPLTIGPVRAGAITGATKYFGKPSGLGGALFSYTLKEIEWHVLVVPKVRNLTPTTAMLSTSF